MLTDFSKHAFSYAREQLGSPQYIDKTIAHGKQSRKVSAIPKLFTIVTVGNHEITRISGLATKRLKVLVTNVTRFYFVTSQKLLDYNS